MLIIKSTKNNKCVEFDIRSFCYESTFIYDLFLLDEKNYNEIEDFYSTPQYLDLDIDYNILLLIKEYFSNNILNLDNFLTNLSQQELFDITTISDFFCMNTLLEKSCKVMANRILKCKTENDLINYFDINNSLTDEEFHEIKKS